MLGVVVAGTGALVYFNQCLLAQLAHFGSHDLLDVFTACTQLYPHLAQQLAALHQRTR